MNNPYGLAPDKSVLVYGLGGSGRAVVDKLSAYGIPLLLSDDKGVAATVDWPSSILAQATATWIKPNEAPDWRDIQLFVKAPGIAMNAPLVQAAVTAKVPVMGEIDLFYTREAGRGAKFIGITGSNGKSTTTSLIAHVLRHAGYMVAEGGNLGTPALYLPELPKGGFYVLELSSYQLEMAQKLRLDSAILLNLTPNHLERHTTMDGYLAAKRRIFDICQPAVRVMGIDQPILRTAGINATTVSVDGQGADIGVDAKGMLVAEGKVIGDLSTLGNLLGPHNWQNIACAYGAIRQWVSDDVFMPALPSFRPLPHRMEKVLEKDGITYINDSKSTTGESSARALMGLSNIYWICGGRAKIGGLGPALEHLQHVKAAFTIGEATDAFVADIAAKGTPAFPAHTLERALADARAAAQIGGMPAVILFSPACASFDQFKSFEHRGDCFVHAVRDLP